VKVAHQFAPGLTEAIATKQTTDAVAKGEAAGTTEGSLHTADQKRV